MNWKIKEQIELEIRIVFPSFSCLYLTAQIFISSPVPIAVLSNTQILKKVSPFIYSTRSNLINLQSLPQKLTSYVDSEAVQVPYKLSMGKEVIVKLQYDSKTLHGGI